MLIDSIFLNRAGLICNIVGALLLASSIDKNIDEAYQENRRGKKLYLAIVKSPFRLISGIVLIIIGFIAQFVATYF